MEVLARPWVSALAGRIGPGLTNAVEVALGAGLLLVALILAACVEAFTGAIARRLPASAP